MGYFIYGGTDFRAVRTRNLSPAVKDIHLYEIFNQVGTVASIKVCCDAMTRRSLGYAYVNYHNAQDAERAKDTLNFTSIKGKAC
jgi:polyadenylate-binding protein